MPTEIENIPVIIIILAAIWTIPWKGVALWKSARAGSKAWFMILLLINTLAILEILYIFVFSKRIKKENQEENQAPIQVRQV